MEKVLLITGASSGIGKDAAILLQQKGFVVYAAARRLDKMQDLKEAGIRLLQIDVTNDDSMVKGIQEIMDTEKRIDVLVNNAGYGSLGALEDIPLLEAKRQYEVNVFGLARLIQLVLPIMRAQKYGRIINVSSIAGKVGLPFGTWYHSSKFALEGLSDSLRMEVKQFGIDVVLIEPGAIKTDWNPIARENLMKVSGNTDYKDAATKQYNTLLKFDKRGSHPIVIAKTIVKAATKNKPRTRYVAGSGAKLILFVRSILSDKMLDKLMLSQLK